MHKIKKIVAYIMLFTILLPIQVHASGNRMNLTVQGQHEKVTAADVQVNGFTLRSKYRPYIHQDRTFVPIRELTELMGANVTWHQKTKSVGISMADQEVMLRIDSPVVYVNGQQKTIDWDSIPRLATYRDLGGETKTMVPLRFLSESLGFEVNWNQSQRLASVSNGVVTIEDHEATTWNAPEEQTQKQVIPEQKITSTKESSKEKKKSEASQTPQVKDDTQSQKSKPSNKGAFVVVVDAGHGGSDCGAIALDGTTEADLNLQVAQLLKPKLEARGFVVKMTRTADTTTGLRSRPALANELEADVFLSIHFNSAGSEKARGIEVLYASEKDVARKGSNQYRLAKEVLDQLIKDTGAYNRGVKNRPDLVVLNSSDMDAALVELGFLSNQEDLETIHSSGYLNTLAKAIDQGIANYKKKFID